MNGDPLVILDALHARLLSLGLTMEADMASAARVRVARDEEILDDIVADSMNTARLREQGIRDCENMAQRRFRVGSGMGRLL